MARQARASIEGDAREEQPLLPISVPQRQANRAGKKTIAGHFDPPIARAMAILAAKEDRTLVSLLGEAIEDLLKKYGEEITPR